MDNFIIATDAQAISNENKKQKEKIDAYTKQMRAKFPEKYDIANERFFVRIQIKRINRRIKESISEGKTYYVQECSRYNDQNYYINQVNKSPVIFYPETVEFFKSLGYNISGILSDLPKETCVRDIYRHRFTQFISWL